MNYADLSLRMKRSGKTLAYEAFLEERNEAFLSLDRGKIEAFLHKYNIDAPKDDEVFWRAVHKAICNLPHIPIERRQQSADWLFAHGSTPDIS